MRLDGYGDDSEVPVEVAQLGMDCMPSNLERLNSLQTYSSLNLVGCMCYTEVLDEWVALGRAHRRPTRLATTGTSLSNFNTLNFELDSATYAKLTPRMIVDLISFIIIVRGVARLTCVTLSTFVTLVTFVTPVTFVTLVTFVPLVTHAALFTILSLVACVILY